MKGCSRTPDCGKTLSLSWKKRLCRIAFNFLDLCKPKVESAHWAKNHYQFQGDSINVWESLPKDIKIDLNFARPYIPQVHSYNKANTIKSKGKLSKTSLCPNSKS
jgi:hypothetical protein